MLRWVCGPFLLAFSLASCDDRSVPTQEETEQLDNAEEMLNQADEVLEGIDENGLAEPVGNEAEPQ